MLEEIEKLKKIELHVHLDGSVSLDLASKVTNLPILKIKEQMVAKDKCLDLGEYLSGSQTFPRCFYRLSTWKTELTNSWSNSCELAVIHALQYTLH